MKCAPPLLLLLLASPLSAEEPKAPPPAAATPAVKAEVPYAKVDYKNEVYLWEGKPFTGKATENHRNGKPSLSYEFLDGQLHGLIREWYEDGTAKTATLFKNGKRHGKSTYWHPDGSVMKEQLYEEDVLKEDKHFEKGEKK